MTKACVSFAGNLTDGPELRHTEGGIAGRRGARSRPVGDRAARRNGFTGRVLPGRWYYAIALLTQRWTLRAWNLPLAEALGNPHD
jgi:hypothetical protein